VADAVHALTGLSPFLKWPNDLLLQNRKFAGLLVETVSRKNLPPLALLGLGLNLHQQTGDFPPELQSSAISLLQATGQTIPRARMLTAFLNNLLLRLDRPLPESLNAWRKACPQLGQPVTVSTGTEIIHGVADNLDNSGHLHLRLPDGTHRILASGETDFPA
jgi:BirA family transcriptional regulator, biotin operon repressor / biotin---[acetyl-CoA-carboxylase] ligase